MSRVIQIGNLISESNFANPQRGRIYSIEGIAPCLETCGGDNLGPKIMIEAEIKILGNFSPSGHGYADVHSTDGISPTLRSECHGNPPYILTEKRIEAKVQSIGNTNPSGHGINGEVYDTDGIAPTLMKAKGEGVRILEPVIASMRGRNPDNPSERAKSNGRYRQRLEVGGIVSNTIISVQKDNLVIEPQVLTPKRNDYGKKMRKKYESGELDESRHNMTDLVPRNDGIANTLTSVQKDNLLVEPLRIPQATSKGYIEVPEGGLFDGAYPNSQTRRGRVQEGGEICPALTTESANQIFRYESRCRIRKLTERECFRLMDVDEDNIDKIQSAGISRTQQYKMAGNSIVTSCLYYIFRNLFTEQEKTTLF